MIVEVVDVDRLTLLEPEGDSPIAGHQHRKVTLQLAFERVQPQAREIQILRPAATIQQGQNVSQLLQMLRCYSSRRPTVVERLEPSMLERPDHSLGR